MNLLPVGFRQTIARGVTAVLLAGLACNCGGQSPVSPTVVPVASPSLGGPPSPAGPFRTISGSIVEVTPEGTQPLGGVAVNAWIDQGRSGYSYWWANGPVYSDASGRYDLVRVPEAGTAHSQAWSNGYVQPCAAPVNSSSGTVVQNIYLVRRADASSLLPALMARTPGGVVSGRILDSAGQPIAGAFVDFEPIMDFPAATNYSDADGRYTLCGLPAGIINLGAGLGRRVAYVTVSAGQMTADIVLPD